jgi:hypothetical protein
MTRDPNWTDSFWKVEFDNEVKKSSVRKVLKLYAEYQWPMRSYFEEIKKMLSVYYPEYLFILESYLLLK